MGNAWFITLVFWPLVVLLCAGINMLCSWTFSWSELVFDYLVGVLAGFFLFAGTQADASEAAVFFFVFSHGAFAWVWAASDGFRAWLGDAGTFFWMMAAIRIGATLWASLWDLLSVKIGAGTSVPAVVVSVLVAPAKWPFALFTSLVGVAIWIGGVAKAIVDVMSDDADKGKVGFAGGVLISEFSPSSSGHHATTVGATVHTWFGGTPFRHELYHSRQYIYLGDWLVPFWCLGIGWGLASAAIAGKNVGRELAFGADRVEEIGNPLEVAAYHMGSRG